MYCSTIRMTPCVGSVFLPFDNPQYSESNRESTKVRKRETTQGYALDAWLLRLHAAEASNTLRASIGVKAHPDHLAPLYINDADVQCFGISGVHDPSSYGRRWTLHLLVRQARLQIPKHSRKKVPLDHQVGVNAYLRAHRSSPSRIARITSVLSGINSPFRSRAMLC
jgi:hypothetical protein